MKIGPERGPDNFIPRGFEVGYFRWVSNNL